MKRAAGQELDRSELPVLGDAGPAARPGRAAEQHAPLCVCADHGLHGVLLGFPETNVSRSLRPAAGRRTRISMPVDDPGPTVDAQVLDDLGESTQPDVRRDGASPLREQGPHLADGGRAWPGRRR